MPIKQLHFPKKAKYSKVVKKTASDKVQMLPAKHMSPNLKQKVETCTTSKKEALPQKPLSSPNKHRNTMHPVIQRGDQNPFEEFKQSGQKEEHIGDPDIQFHMDSSPRGTAHT